MTDASSFNGPMRRFAGLIVIVFGIFFLMFAGLCSAVYLFSFFAEGDLNNLGAALIVAIPSALVGRLIISSGRALWAKR